MTQREREIREFIESHSGVGQYGKSAAIITGIMTMVWIIVYCF